LTFATADPAAGARPGSSMATAPTVTIEKASAQADPTNTSPILFTVTFSTPVTGFTPADIKFSGSTAPGTLTAAVTGTGASYTVTYTPAGPTVTINQAAAQSDPTNTPPIVFDVAFSTAVTGFDASDISFTGSTVGGAIAAQVSGSGATYAVSVTGITGTGTVVA